MTRIYVAAPLALAGFAQAFSREAAALGFTVVSTWHQEVLASGAKVDPTNRDVRQVIAETCEAQITESEMLIAFTHEGAPRGTYIEIGIAMGQGTPVLWVQVDGRYEPIFDAHAGVTVLRVDAGADPHDIAYGALEVLDGMRREA